MKQASAGRRRSRLPGILNSLFWSLESCFVSKKFAHQPRMPWTKTRMSATTLKMGKTHFKDPGRRGRRRPEEPCSRAPAMNWISNLLDVDSEWFAMYALTCIFWAILGTKMINSEPQHYNNWCIQKQILHFWSTCPNWNLWNISEFYDT